MKTLDKGQDKIQKICDDIRSKTLDPAKEEAQQIIAAAKRRAEEIISAAEKHSLEMFDAAKATIEQERHVFQSSLVQASKQALESLRQSIEQRLFSADLKKLLDKPLSDPKIIAALINAITRSIEKEGFKTKLEAIVANTVSPQEVVSLLLQDVRSRLKDETVAVGPFDGGVQIKLLNNKMTIDLTDQVLKELLANYIRKDFRELIFGKV